jgi:hypothetical protein
VADKTQGMSGEYTTWSAGYLTAFNLRTPGTYDILGNTDINGAMLWLENYCRNNPLERFATAWNELFNELSPTRTTQKPK